jgi:predicted dehydrogenase
MQVGIVGAGTIFESHAKAYKEIGIPVGAVVDIDPKRAEAAALANGVTRALTSWGDLLKIDEIGIVDVCTPPGTHREVVIAALRAGKHVVCEKPLTPTLEEMDEVSAVADQSSGKLTAVHQLRFQSGYRRLKWLVANGHLGKICLARQIRFDPPPKALVEKGVWGGWRSAGGGVVMTKAIHQLDLLLWIMGDARRVQAMMGTYWNRIESEDQALVNIEFASGAQGSVVVSGHPFGNREEMELIGDRGRASLRDLRLKDQAAQRRIEAEMEAIWPGPSRLQRKLMGLRRRLGLADAAVAAEGHADHTPFLRSFVDAVDGKGEVPVSAREARTAIELCTAIYAAALTGETIELPLDPSARFYGGIQQGDYATTP